MKLSEHLESMGTAPSADGLESAFQAAVADFPLAASRRTYRRIKRAMYERGVELCRAHPRGDLIPIVGPRRRLSLYGDTYNVGYGQNGAGERWVWAGAEVWCDGKLKDAGLDEPLRKEILDCAWQWPHRALKRVQALPTQEKETSKP